MRSIIPTSLLNVGAFSVNALAQLAIIPLIVDHYGLASLGLLALVRLLTPSGALALLCPGLQTSAVRWAARRENEHRFAALLWALAFGVICGVVVAVLLLVVESATIVNWLEAPAQQAEQLSHILLLLALVQPILFAGAVAQGLLTGYRRFGLLRSADVIATLAFLFVVFIGGSFDLGFPGLLVAYICFQSTKALWFAVASYWELLTRERTDRKRDWLRARNELLKELKTLAFADMAAAGVAQIPAAIIAAMGGAELLGLYDGLRRIPMALKQLAGSARTAVLPVAIDLGDSIRYRRALALRGSFIAGLCLIPLGLHFAVFSGDLLRLWLGQSFSAHAWVFAAMMLEFLVVQAHGVLMVASISHLSMVRKETILRGVQLVIILGALPWVVTPGDLLPAAIVLLAVALAGRSMATAFYLPFFGVTAKEWLAMQGRVFIIPTVFALVADTLASPLDPALRLLVVMPASLLASLVAVLLIARGEERIAIHQTYAEVKALKRELWRSREALPADDV